MNKDEIKDGIARTLFVTKSHMRANVTYFPTIKKMGKDETKFKQRTLDPVVVDVDLASSV